ncbi:MAG TPA: ABC transporter family substrate-binding protein [Candidatus Corynebacterium faecipullorum]|nr:ABC transporter family substrate-binding protein [Candidatus Corynebacterium faecipullorum]
MDRFLPRLGVILAAALLTACQANPGPPPVVDEDDRSATPTNSSTTAPPPEAAPEEDLLPKRSTVAIGVDPLRGGLNPHLVANSSELVNQIAELVLPSAFHGTEMDTDVLESAEEIEVPEGVAMRVRYTIAAPAQWSDGTPISGSDFNYLWSQITRTPGAKNISGYRAISAVRTSGNGRVVTVDFDHRVEDWHKLFAHLMPSHLLEDRDFASVLAEGIPASAGRYLVESMDRGRGIITLNRNDRFWGEDPANIDVIQLRAVRDTAHAVNMLRSRQIGFADFTPQQTTLENLSLLSNVNTGVVTRQRQLRLEMSAAEGALNEQPQRRALASLLDTDQIARLATGRASELEPGNNPFDSNAELAPLRERAGRKPVRIGVDPQNPTALAAATTIVDVLQAKSIDAEVVTERLTTITSDLLPAGKVDAVVAWDENGSDAMSLANYFVCATPTRPAATLSGFCPENSAETALGILSGELDSEAAEERVEHLNREEVLFVPLLNEVRVHALGKGIVGPGQSIKDWDSGLISAPQWRKDDD